MRFDGSHEQGFGGYDLRFHRHGIDMILGIIKAVGAPSWEKLIGRYARIVRDGRKNYSYRTHNRRTVV